MADVDRSEKNRGQIILVTGLVIAVVLVALVLLLNAVIYTENLSTRGVDSGGNDAIEYRATMVGGIGELLDRENANNRTEWDTLEGVVDRGVVNMTTAIHQSYLQSGVVVGADANYVQGTQLVADQENFSDGELVTNVTEIRSFTIDTSVDYPNESNAFEIRIDPDDEDEWVLQLYKNESDYLFADDGNNICYTEEIDEIEPHNSSWCENGNYDWPSYDSYLIRFNNSDQVNSSFVLTVRGESGEDDFEDFDEFVFVYEAIIDIRYSSTEIEFGTSVIAEGSEPHG